MDSRGFSLLEVTITMAILGILTTIADASVSRSIDTAKGRQEVEKVKDALVRARNIARYQLKCVTVDVQPDHVDIIPWDICSPGLASPEPTQTIQFDPTITLGQFDVGNPLVFNSFGGTSAPAPTVMSVTTSAGTIYQYQVTPAIGSVSLLR